MQEAERLGKLHNFVTVRILRCHMQHFRDFVAQDQAFDFFVKVIFLVQIKLVELYLVKPDDSEFQQFDKVMHYILHLLELLLFNHIYIFGFLLALRKFDLRPSHPIPHHAPTQVFRLARRSNIRGLSAHVVFLYPLKDVSEEVNQHPQRVRAVFEVALDDFHLSLEELGVFLVFHQLLHSLQLGLPELGVGVVEHRVNFARGGSRLLGFSLAVLGNNFGCWDLLGHLSLVLFLFFVIF